MSDTQGRQIDKKQVLSGEPKILLLDNHLAVLEKPPGFLSQANGSGCPDVQTWLKHELKIRFNKPGQVFAGLVHRLDQPVGGVMVLARTSKAASRLSAQIRDRQFEKYYLAIVDGCPDQPAGTLTDRISKDKVANMARIVPQGEGQESWLDYRVLEERRDLNRSLLAIRLGSGRSHQIRLQLSARGWPIVGDRRYNAAYLHADSLVEPRDPALYACCLAFCHPVGNQRLVVAAEPPRKFPWSDFQLVDGEAMPGLFVV